MTRYVRRDDGRFRRPGTTRNEPGIATSSRRGAEFASTEAFAMRMSSAGRASLCAANMASGCRQHGGEPSSSQR